jgi:hypothetical protein
MSASMVLLNILMPNVHSLFLLHIYLAVPETQHLKVFWDLRYLTLILYPRRWNAEHVSKNGLDIAAATLNAVKGRAMRIDLCSITQKDKRIFSFLSQSAGLVVDLAVNTEHLRWLGSSRLKLGYLREGVLSRRLSQAPILIKFSFQSYL